jgi:hypothetical protein
MKAMRERQVRTVDFMVIRRLSEGGRVVLREDVFRRVLKAGAGLSLHRLISCRKWP